LDFEDELLQAARGSYRRGQVERALWRWATTADRLRDPPVVFLVRIKRLLEIDRAGGDKKAADTAFYSELPRGTGTDVSYSAFNVFCLAIGLDLLDAGFKQAEVVALLQGWREQVVKTFDLIVQSPPLLVPGKKLRPSQRPGSPKVKQAGELYADCSVYAVIEKIEMTEIFAGHPGAPKQGKPLIRAPKVVRGIGALTEALERLPYRQRKAVVLEIAHTAARVTWNLNQEPAIKRGRLREAGLSE
jgi:hypothetical protein